MKRLLVTTYALAVLAACGTEVGNGFKPDDKKEESNRDTFEESVGSGGVPTSESANVDWTHFLFAACASPFSETVATRYVAGLASLETAVTGNNLRVTMRNAPLATTPSRTGTVAPATDTAFAFDIRHVDTDELVPAAVSATCGTVSSSTSVDEGGASVVTRSVDITFQGLKATVMWRVEGALPGVVRTMSVTLANGTPYTLTAE